MGITIAIRQYYPFYQQIVLAYRTLNYAPYTTLKIHFWVNYGYIAFVAISLVAIFTGWKKSTTTRSQKIRYAFSCISALLLVILIIGWELYY